jgi:hypothetical protein
VRVASARAVRRVSMARDSRCRGSRETARAAVLREPVLFGSREEFLTFTEPGFAKAVVGFRLDPRGAQTLLTTETRFVATDEATHRLMSRYWGIIRPGSSLIRTQWLRAIRGADFPIPGYGREAELSAWDSSRSTSGVSAVRTRVAWSSRNPLLSVSWFLTAVSRSAGILG